MSENYIVHPSENITGEITVPGDKSISHRAVIFGSLASGVSEFTNFLTGEDCLATLNAFKEMGVIANLSDDQLIIQGVGINGLNKASEALYLGNSGTSARLLVGLLGAQNFESTIEGDESLSGRPMNRVVDPLEKMGANFELDHGVLIGKTDGLKGVEINLPYASVGATENTLLAAVLADGTTTIENAAH